MSTVRCKVVKCFATCTTSESVLGDVFAMCLVMVIKDRLVSKPFVAAGAFIKFVPSMDSLMGY